MDHGSINVIFYMRKACRNLNTVSLKNKRLIRNNIQTKK